MAGEALTSSFMLSTATVMLGAQADLFNLNPADNSIGLVKNFTMTAEPGYTELTQGVKNSVVYSVMTSNVVRANMEVYEYTGRNIAYSLGLEGASITPTTDTTTVDTITVADATTVPVLATTGFAVGDYVTIKQGAADQLFVRKITAVTLDESIEVNAGIPIALAVGAVVSKVNVIGIGSKVDQPFLAAKIVGTLADGSDVAILIPKLRITNGFSLAFTTDNFGNLPYQFTVYDQVATDPNYALFADVGQAMLVTGQ